MLKKETRILGLSAPILRLDHFLVVGVVFRGRRWLDGVFTCWLMPSRRDYLSELVEAITQSKQYSQIRVVILAREKPSAGMRIDATALARRLRRPVISIIEKRTVSKLRTEIPRLRLKRNSWEIEVHGKVVPVETVGISCVATREIFDVACSNTQVIPEAVRVAELIGKHLSRLKFMPYIKGSVKLRSVARNSLSC